LFPQSSCPCFLNLKGVTLVPASSGVETVLTVPRDAVFIAIGIGILPRVFVSAV